MEKENLPAVQANQSKYYGLVPTNFEQSYRMAKIMAASGLMPKGIQTPEAVFVAMQMGAEIGLSPMASVQNIAVIHNRPGLYGDVALAVVRASGELEVFEEWSGGERKTPEWTYYCKIKRRGGKEVTGSYSWAEACEAGQDKADPLSSWKKWTNRMMQFKARNFVLRDYFTDILKGIRIAEDNVDAIDMEPTEEKNGSATYQVAAPITDDPIETGLDTGSPAFDIAVTERYSDEKDIVSIMTFVKLTADANKTSVEALKDRAMNNWEEFIKAFDSWKAKNNAPKHEPAPENETIEEPKAVSAIVEEIPPPAPLAEKSPWADFRSKFINLKSSGYSTFVYQNIELFRASPKDISKEAIEKWVKLYPGQPWPVNATVEARLAGGSVTHAPAVADKGQIVGSAHLPGNPPENSTASIPISYTPEYKALTDLRHQFPDYYSQAKAELNMSPSTVFNCLNLIALINKKVDQAVETFSGEAETPDGLPDDEEFEKF